MLASAEKPRKRMYARAGVCAFVCALVFMASIFLSGCTDTTTMNQLQAQVQQLQSQNAGLQSQNAELQSQNADLQAKVQQAQPWFEMTEQQQKEKEAELQKEKDAEAKAEADKEAADKQAKEAEEKKGYDTGITYDQLARNPDNYVGQKVKFTGEVVQVLEGGGAVNLRFAVNADYDKMVYVKYQSNIVSSRVLENDTITIYGVSQGLYSYTSTMGATITIPEVSVDKIDQ